MYIIKFAKYKVVQIWPGLVRLVYTQISPGHIWTTLYITYLDLRASVYSGAYIQLAGIRDQAGVTLNVAVQVVAKCGFVTENSAVCCSR
jgi:hypothetical protein